MTAKAVEIVKNILNFEYWFNSDEYIEDLEELTAIVQVTKMIDLQVKKKYLI